MYHTLIVEDDLLIRQLLEEAIAESQNFHLVAGIDNADYTEVFLSAAPVDLVIMDIHTAQRANGLEASERIKKRYPHIKIVMITSMPEFSYLDKAVKIGVDSFWYKSAPKEELLRVLEKTMLGQHIYPEHTPTVYLGACPSTKLSHAELTVLREVAAGHPDDIIAQKLNISPSTVRTHISSLRDKTGFRNRTELASEARSLGLVIPER